MLAEAKYVVSKLRACLAQIVIYRFYDDEYE